MAEPVLLLTNLWRNLEWLSFERGWGHDELREELGITKNTLNRLRFGRSRYIDPEILMSACEVFELTPNDLLFSKPEVERRYQKK